jgi:hypothetical protein
MDIEDKIEKYLEIPEYALVEFLQKNSFWRIGELHPPSESVRVRVSIEEKETRVFAIALAFATDATSSVMVFDSHSHTRSFSALLHHQLRYILR